jgi:hypothetical protein
MTTKVGAPALLGTRPDAELGAVVVQARQLALAEQQPVSRYAFQADGVTLGLGIFDTLARDEGRLAHLGGEIAKTSMAAGAELLARAPDTGAVDLLVVK